MKTKIQHNLGDGSDQKEIFLKRSRKLEEEQTKSKASQRMKIKIEMEINKRENRSWGSKVQYREYSK